MNNKIVILISIILLTIVINSCISSVLDKEKPLLYESFIKEDQLSLNYNEDLKQNSIPPIDDFIVIVNEEEVNIKEIDIDNNSVIISLESPVVINDYVKISYLKNSETIKDKAGNEADNLLNRDIINFTGLTNNYWSEPNPPTIPYKRGGHSCAYNYDDHYLVLHGGGYASYFTLQYDVDINDWDNTSQSGPDRNHHRWVYVGNNKIILFGGNNITPIISDVTWEYNVLSFQWTELNPPNKPSARKWFDMKYTRNDKVILFGGSSGGDETWEYDVENNDWVQLFPDGDIPGRNGLSMAYDFEHHQIILFGGLVNGIAQNDTWIFDINDNTWTEVITGVKPSPRADHAMGYAGNGTVILFGGWTNTPNETRMNDTWKFNTHTNQWIELEPEGTPPCPRNLTELDYVGNGKFILVAGTGPGEWYQDMYQFVIPTIAFD